MFSKNSTIKVFWFRFDLANFQFFRMFQKIGIFELPNGIDVESNYIKNIHDKTTKGISKHVRKTFPKDCLMILKKGISLDKTKHTDPNNVNLNSILGNKTISI